MVSVGIKTLAQMARTLSTQYSVTWVIAIGNTLTLAGKARKMMSSATEATPARKAWVVCQYIEV